MRIFKKKVKVNRYNDLYNLVPRVALRSLNNFYFVLKILMSFKGLRM